MSATPTWLGDAGRPIAAWVHLPDHGAASGAVVICPPVAQEYTGSFRTLRHLADRLTEQGVVAIRFDYPGTGDSYGDWRSANLVEHWLDSIVVAVEYARSLGSPRVGAIGMRLGATLAASAIERCEPVSAVVLWDPCATGRSFVREQRALFRIVAGDTEGPPPGAALTSAGMSYSSQTIQALEQVTLDALPFESRASRVERTLLLTRADRPAPAEVKRLGERATVVCGDATAQDLLLDCPPYAAVPPRETIRSVISFVAKRLTGPLQQIRPTVQTVAVVAEDLHGRPIVERFTHLGPDRLFAVVTDPPVPTAKTVVMINGGTDHHVGPGRAWVDLARAGALTGLASVRFDRRGVGDTYRLGDPDDPLALTAQSRDDTLAVIDALPCAPSDLALLGICAGGWMAAAAALERPACAVFFANMGLWQSRPAELSAGQAAVLSGDSGGGERGRGWLRRIAAKPAVKRRLPYAVWWSLDRLNLEPNPARLTAMLLKRGVRVRIFAAVGDSQPVSGPRGAGLRSQIRRGRLIDIHVSPQADHSLLRWDGRAALIDYVLAQVTRDFGVSADGTLPTDPRAFAGAG